MLKCIAFNAVFVVAVFVVVTSRPDPVVREFATMAWALVVVPVNVWVAVPVPEDITKFWFAPTVRVPLDVNPDVAVIRPDIVGVAVQDVGTTVREEPVIVERKEALPKVVAAPMPWKIGDDTDVPTLIAAENEGAPAFATKTVFAAPCAVACTTPVAFPYNTPFDVSVVAPVPPLATVRVPVVSLMISTQLVQSVCHSEMVSNGSLSVLYNVPETGNVTFVIPVNVLVYAKLPELVTVAAALFATPVPPYVGLITEAFHVPVVITPVFAVTTNPLYEAAPVIAPAADISMVGVFKKLVYPAPPVFVILIASVTTVVPRVVVSALSKRRRADTALSVTLDVAWFWILTADPVFPAILGLFVKSTARPVIPELAMVD